MSPPRMGGTLQTPPLLRNPRYAKTLYAHPRDAKTLYSPFRMAIFDTSVPSLCSGTENQRFNEIYLKNYSILTSFANYEAILQNFMQFCRILC